MALTDNREKDRATVEDPFANLPPSSHREADKGNPLRRAYATSSGRFR
jgi:hypothetical protein